jgi:hypothetical protein
MTIRRSLELSAPLAAGSADSERIDIPQADASSIMRRRRQVSGDGNPNWMNMKPVQELINQVVGDGKRN